jgi:beta-mannosidase
VNQDDHPASGSYCIVEVNNRPVFLKGGNWVPVDLIMARGDEARYRTLIDLSLEANFNFMRVWGGGLYETDLFYDLCDENGILVWQDAAFACRKYPLYDEELFFNTKEELRYQIRRLASHPSLAVWCGNNEMEWGNWDWGLDKGVIYPDYAFFHLVIPTLMTEEDPTRYYQPSSPFSPNGASPNLDDRGDQHNWNVSLNHTDYREFRELECRLMNEGGYLGPNSYPTLLECFPDGEEPKIGSFAWFHHDNSVDSWYTESISDQCVLDHLGREIRSMSLEEHVYLGGLLHGEALATFSDNFRRRMYESSAACFWMYNDCWPTSRSWTIVDYGLRRTPAFWAVKRAFQPLRVVITHEADVYTVFGVNDSNQPVQATLETGFCMFASGIENQESTKVILEPNASTVLATFADRGDPEVFTKGTAIARLLDTGAGSVLSENRYLGPRLHELELSKTEINVVCENGTAVFTSEVYAMGVCIDVEGETALEDNFFDLLPGIPKKISWTFEMPPVILGVFNNA